MYRVLEFSHSTRPPPFAKKMSQSASISEGMYVMARAVRTLQGYIEATLRLVPTLPARKQAELIEECTSMSNEANELIRIHNELLQKQKALAAGKKGREEEEGIHRELEALSLAGLTLKNARAKKERQLLSSQSQDLY
jgi:hypothetical protein